MWGFDWSNHFCSVPGDAVKGMTQSSRSKVTILFILEQSHMTSRLYVCARPQMVQVKVEQRDLPRNSDDLLD